MQGQSIAESVLGHLDHMIIGILQLVHRLDVGLDIPRSQGAECAKSTLERLHNGVDLDVLVQGGSRGTYFAADLAHLWAFVVKVDQADVLL